MKLESIARLSSLIFLSSFIALMLSSGEYPAYAQSTHTITINNNCTETVWIGANGTPSIQSITVNGQAVTTFGGWEMTTGQTAIVTVPLTWQNGRFWARTGCKFQADGTCPAARLLRYRRLYGLRRQVRPQLQRLWQSACNSCRNHFYVRHTGELRCKHG